MTEQASPGSAKPIHLEIMRSPLSRARGLGAARSGLSHWWAERVTSIALVPLTLWFIWSIYGLLGASQADVAAWVGRPLPLVLMLCLVLATFHHMQLGLQVVIEDYIHQERARLAALLVMRGGTFLLGVFGVVALLKIGL